MRLALQSIITLINKSSDSQEDGDSVWSRTVNKWFIDRQ